MERFLVRDLDSRMTSREAAAVLEWIDSEKPFHAMRDHPQHGTEILGGLWGAKKGLIKNMRYLMDNWNWHFRSSKGDDQIFLREIIWPLCKDQSLVHDSYTCHTYGGEQFPTPRTQDYVFVGEVISPTIASSPKPDQGLWETDAPSCTGHDPTRSRG